MPLQFTALSAWRSAGLRDLLHLPEPPACSAVKKLVHEGRLPHLLFYGPPGTGKTSTILAVARQIYGKSMANMVLEMNASDDRGIGVVRQQVVDFASTRTMFRCILVIIPLFGGSITHCANLLSIRLLGPFLLHMPFHMKKPP